MGALTTSNLEFSIAGNKRVVWGRLAPSSSYATSGETYVNRQFGLGVVDRLMIYPANGYAPEWNSGATTVKFRTGGNQPGSVGQNLVIQGANATAGAAMLVGWPSQVVISAATGIRGSVLANLQASSSTAADWSTQISTSQTMVTMVHYALPSGGGFGLPLYAISNGVLVSTATVNIGLSHLIPLSDGGMLQASNDASAATFFRLLATDSAATGLRIRTTGTYNISIPVSTSFGMAIGAGSEIPSATNLSAQTWSFEAVGA